jgi:hypothetical protein
MFSAVEAEIGSSFINAKKGAVLRTALEEVGHPHPPTPMKRDNITATGYRNGTIEQKCTKAMDMRFYWIKDRVKHVKLLPLPHPPVHARTDARTNPSAQRATQLRSVPARVYDVSRQNQTTTTVPYI